MGDFKSYQSGERDRNSDRPRGRSFGGDRRGGRGGFGDRRGGRGGFGGRSGGRDRRDMAPCDAVCSKCGKDCKVPFKPRGDKPVYCNDCFGAQNSGNYSNAERASISPSNSSSKQSVSAEDFKKLSAKVDKILEILSSLEIVEDDSEDEDRE